VTVPVGRYKLTVAYRGTRYHGWQHQEMPPNWKGARPPAGHGLPTVQEILTRAMIHVLKEPITLHGSSRTDAGVHAKRQAVHFDTTRVQVPTESMRRAINHQLPDDILVRAIEPVPHNFHVIKCTASKRYQYAIWNHLDRPPFVGDLFWHRWQPLDVDAMRRAAQYLVGTHDFATFAKPGHQRETTVRTIVACDVSFRNPKLVIGVEGTGFLWNMVRIVAGTLVEVGLGRYTPADMTTMLEARDRRAGGSTAPPHGLYLQWIRFRASEERDREESKDMSDREEDEE
jgi:tRNA pseudouridine38-40 synthase